MYAPNRRTENKPVSNAGPSESTMYLVWMKKRTTTRNAAAARDDAQETEAVVRRAEDGGGETRESEERDHDPEAQTSRVGLAVEQEVRRDVVGAERLGHRGRPPEREAKPRQPAGDEVGQPAGERDDRAGADLEARARRPRDAGRHGGGARRAPRRRRRPGLGRGRSLGGGSRRGRRGSAEVAELLRPEAAVSQPAEAARVRGRSSAPAPPRPGGGRPPTLPTRSSTERAPIHPADSSSITSRPGSRLAAGAAEPSGAAQAGRPSVGATWVCLYSAMRVSRLGAARSVPMPTRRCTEARCAQRRESDRNPPTIAVTPPISATTCRPPAGRGASRSRSCAAGSRTRSR